MEQRPPRTATARASRQNLMAWLPDCSAYEMMRVSWFSVCSLFDLIDVVLGDRHLDSISPSCLNGTKRRAVWVKPAYAVCQTQSQLVMKSGLTWWVWR